ncbi:MAG: protein kinase [Candidatus Omnitrophota bacterium]
MIKVGDKIGNIDVIEQISDAGWYADVFKAKDNSANNVIAIKVLKKISDEERKRFERENHILHTLKPHENIILPLSEVLNHADNIYYLLELADFNLEKYLLANSDPNICELLDIFIQICNGLKYAHSKRIVHRDLHKGNILLKENGNNRKVKLSDFGLGKDFKFCLETVTTSYIPLRAITIAAPEVLSQIVNKDSTFESDALADIFSLGIIFHCIFNRLSVLYATRIIELKEKGQELGIYLKGTAHDKRKKFHNYVMQTFDLYELKKYFCVLIEGVDEKINGKINSLISLMTEPEFKKRISSLDNIIQEVITIKNEIANV